MRVVAVCSFAAMCLQVLITYEKLSFVALMLRNMRQKLIRLVSRMTDCNYRAQLDGRRSNKLQLRIISGYRYEWYRVSFVNRRNSIRVCCAKSDHRSHVAAISRFKDP